MPARPLNATTRIALWFAALLLAALVFSACIGIYRGGPLAIRIVLQFTLFFAMPAWLLYLPLIVEFPGVTRGQLMILATVGILIGPASLIAWNLILPRTARLRIYFL
jgi:hypothetical protein